MATEKNPPVTTGVPAPRVEDDNPKAGPGQVVVTSPTGAKTVVEEDAVQSLKLQGYKISGS